MTCFMDPSLQNITRPLGYLSGKCCAVRDHALFVDMDKEDRKMTNRIKIV